PRSIRPSDSAGRYAVEYYGGHTGMLLRDFMENGAYVPELAAGAGTLLVDADLMPRTEPEPVAQVDMPAPVAAPKPAPKTATAAKPAAKETPAAPAGGFTLRQLLIASGVSLVLGIILGFCLFAGGSDEKVGRREPLPVPEATATPAEPSAPAAAAAPIETEKPKTEAAPAPAAAGGVEDAVAYLDANRTWNRDAMEKHAAIAGLFDDLNSMNIARITDHWGPLLKDSKNFSAVVRAAAGSKRKNVNVHREGRTTYNKPGDNAIGYLGYTFWIDP
ncbi:MAG: hypothetical protein K2F72_01635, partial [Muribaculaceae bacterium]|nr:hypothetical protein [Muribaculaceae bacterium]